MVVKKKWLTLLATSFGMGAIALEWSALNAILPEIKLSLQASLNQLQWVMTIYGIFVASTLVVWGHCADRYGHKKTYILGLILFIIGGFIVSMTHNVTLIIVSQVLIGLAAGIILPVSQAILLNAFDAHEGNRAIGFWATIVGLCLAFGPSIGGAIAHFADWRLLFTILIVFQCLSLFITAMYVKESKKEDNLPANDIAGAICLTLSLGILVLALDDLNLWPLSRIITLLGISLMGFITLYFIERKADQPIINRKLLRHGSFKVASILNFCLFLCLWPVFFLTPLFLSLVMGYNNLQIGLMMLAVSLPVAILSPVCMPLYHQWGPRKLILTGFSCLIACFVIWLFWSKSSSWPILLAGTVTFGLSWVFIWSPSNITGVTSLPAKEAGIAAGTFITLQELGGTLGLAFIATYTRSFHHFDNGLHAAAWVMLVIAIFGFLLCLRLPKKNN